MDNTLFFCRFSEKCPDDIFQNPYYWIRIFQSIIVNKLKNMKKETFATVAILLMLFVISQVVCIKTHSKTNYEPVDTVNDVRPYDFSQDDIKVDITVYNPVENQCDSDPLVTADNSKIHLPHLKEGRLRWIAVSRDLLEEFEYGEEVVITSKTNPELNGVWEIHDTMNKRFSKRIDILDYSRSDICGSGTIHRVHPWEDPYSILEFYLEKESL